MGNNVPKSVLADGLRTRDIVQGDTGEQIVGTAEMGDAIVKAFEQL